MSLFVLPDHPVLIHIMGYFCMKDLLSFGSTCRKIHSLSCTDSLWHRFCDEMPVPVGSTVASAVACHSRVASAMAGRPLAKEFYVNMVCQEWLYLRKLDRKDLPYTHMPGYVSLKENGKPARRTLTDGMTSEQYCRHEIALTNEELRVITGGFQERHDRMHSTYVKRIYWPLDYDVGWNWFSEVPETTGVDHLWNKIMDKAEALFKLAVEDHVALLSDESQVLRRRKSKTNAAKAFRVTPKCIKGVEFEKKVQQRKKYCKDFSRMLANCYKSPRVVEEMKKQIPFMEQRKQTVKAMLTREKTNSRITK